MTAAADCKGQGLLVPVINRKRCEAKASCMDVCPYDVFEIKPVPQDVRRTFSLATRIKVRVHGGKQAFVVRGEDCHACSQCVTACPEDAITLSAVGRSKGDDSTKGAQD